MNHKLKLCIILALILIGLFFLALFDRIRVSKTSPYFSEYRVLKKTIADKQYTLYVSDTDERREKGLSDIPSLKDNEGMIFIFDTLDYHHFWMKDMKFSLDLIFLKDNRVVDVLENLKPETYPLTFTSKEKADAVIELPVGNIKKTGLSIGDTIL